MNNTPKTRDETGYIVATVILLNCFFFNNNAYVLFGVSAWMLFWGIKTKQLSRENFTTRRAVITGLLLALSTAIAIYIVLKGAPVPVPRP